jgi:hypothetical protein
MRGVFRDNGKEILDIEDSEEDRDNSTEGNRVRETCRFRVD